MAWRAPDDTSSLLIQRTLTRAREQVLEAFDSQRRAIEREQSAKGVMGGPVATRCLDAARKCILQFESRIVPELLDIMSDLAGGRTPPSDALQWVRTSVNQQIDSLVAGFGKRIDELRTAGRVQGNTERLRQAGEQAKRDMEIELGKAEIRSRLVSASPAPIMSGEADYDVMIGHASEDKAEVAEPLAEALRARGLKVWLDKFEIKIGDRIMSRIDEGLRRSRYAVVIISQFFFAKQWTQFELNALAAMEASESRTRILPVWHGMTLADVQAHSPLLAAVRGESTDIGIAAIADEIVSVLQRADESGSEKRASNSVANRRD